MKLTDHSPAAEMRSALSPSALSPQPSALSPQPSARCPLPSWRREVVCGLLLVGVALTVLAFHFGSARAILCSLRGEKLIIDLDPRKLAAIRPGETADIPFTIQNVSWSRLKIIGAHALCHCTFVKDIPFELASGESKQFNIGVRIDRDEHRSGFEESVRLYVDSPDQVVMLKVPVLVSR